MNLKQTIHKKTVDVITTPIIKDIVTTVVKNTLDVTNTIGITTKSSDDLINRRYEICKKCEFHSGDKSNYRNANCSKCGCQFENKLSIVESHCPINKW